MMNRRLHRRAALTMIGAAPLSLALTAQLIWLTGDDLATVSVTRLDGVEEWRAEIAYSIARLLAFRQESRAR